MTLFTLTFFILYTVLSVTLCWTDARTGLLPNRFTCPLLWTGLLSHLCLNSTQLSNAVWGVIGGYSAMAMIYWGYRGIRKREGLGYGDVKYLAALGAWHGWQSLPLLVFIAASGACFFIVSRALWYGSILDIKSPLPFGPFLGAAGFIIMGISLFNLQL